MLVAAGVSQKLKQIYTYMTKGPLWHIKTKAKAELWLWEKGLQWGKIGEESKSIPKAVARDIPHVEEKKKRNQKPEQRRNKSCRRKKKKKKRKKGILTLMPVIVKVRVISFNERG